MYKFDSTLTLTVHNGAIAKCDDLSAVWKQAVVDIRLHSQCAIAPALFVSSIYYLSISPISAKLTLLLYICASKSLMHLFLRQCSLTLP